MTRPSLETEHLTKMYGSFTALDDLNLKIEGGKCVGFLGPNGAGKTTTLKMLTDMIYPTKGEAFVNGISVQKERRRALADCGVLIESPEIYPSLTPREALEMIGGLRGMDRQTVRRRSDEVLAQVKMSEWADKKTGQFSKGMKQRVNVAAALLPDPEVLLLDEPSTGLDPRGMAEVRSIVRELKQENRLIFMSSHILAEVVDVCDEVALLNRGHLIFYDTLANVTAKYADGGTTAEVRFTAPLSDDQVRERIATIPGITSWERLDPNRLNLAINGNADVQVGVLERLVSLRLGLVNFSESKGALERIYLAQVEKGD